jgi:DNA-binding MarR family transcriptional regulator
MEVRVLCSNNDELWRFYIQFINLKKHYEEELDADLTPQQLNYLKIIANNDHVSFSQLAELTQNSKPTVSEMVNKLIRLNLAYKERCILDNRKSYIFLTDSGKNYVIDDEKIIHHIIDNICKQMERKDLDTVINILSKYQF